MIKEKLKIEAEEWRSNYLGKNYGCLSIGIGALTDAYFAGAEPREKRIKELESQIWKMSELINRYYMVCTSIPKEFRSMTFDSCLEDTVKMVQNRN